MDWSATDSRTKSQTVLADTDSKRSRKNFPIEFLIVLKRSKKIA